jgi:NarL family two-component system response regulator LiaR
MLIRSIEDMEVAGEASDGDEAMEKAQLLEPDIILMDMVLPNKNGAIAIQEIVAQNPKSRIIVLSSFSNDEQIIAAIRGGAKGYILKDSPPEELINAIRDVHRGGSAIQSSIAQKLMQIGANTATAADVKSTLTSRELEILRLSARGMTYHEIADHLTVGEGTVRTHISNLLAKLHLENRTQAVLYAIQEGLVQIDEGDIK